MKGQLKRYWHYLRIRKGVLLGYLVLLAALGLTILELRGNINLVPAEGSSELLRVAPVIGAFGSIALTFGLLILYARQTAVLEQRYKPYLTGEVDSRSPVTTQFIVRNSGSDYAYNLEAKWTLAGDENVWETPSLAPGDTAAFPILVGEDGRWKLHTQQIWDYLEENNSSSEIEYEIRCEDRFGIPRKFSGSVDFEVMLKREESNEIWDVDPLESLANSASSIEASIDAIASDIDDHRDEMEWQNRWTKDQAIFNIVRESEEIHIDVLARILSTNVSSLEYRVTELEKAGYMNYNQRNGKVTSQLSSGENATLSEFP